MPHNPPGRQPGGTLRATGDTGFAPFGRRSPVLSQDPNTRARRAGNGNCPSGADACLRKTPTPAPIGRQVTLSAAAFGRARRMGFRRRPCKLAVHTTYAKEAQGTQLQQTGLLRPRLSSCKSNSANRTRPSMPRTRSGSSSSLSLSVGAPVTRCIVEGMECITPRGGLSVPLA